MVISTLIYNINFQSNFLEISAIPTTLPKFWGTPLSGLAKRAKKKRTFKYEETIAKLSDKVETMVNKNNVPISIGYNRYD